MKWKVATVTLFTLYMALQCMGCRYSFGEFLRRGVVSSGSRIGSGDGFVIAGQLGIYCVLIVCSVIRTWL